TRRLMPTWAIRATNGASRKVNRLASARGMKTSCARRRTATTMTTVRRTVRVLAAWTGPFMSLYEAGIVPRGTACHPTCDICCGARRNRAALARPRLRQTQLDLLEAVHLVAKFCGFLELEVACALEHLGFELFDLADQHFRAHVGGCHRLRPLLAALATCRGRC